MSCARLTVVVTKIRNILKILTFIILKVWNGVLEKRISLTEPTCRGTAGEKPVCRAGGFRNCKNYESNGGGLLKSEQVNSRAGSGSSSGTRSGIAFSALRRTNTSWGGVADAVKNQLEPAWSLLSCWGCSWREISTRPGSLLESSDGLTAGNRK